MSAVFKTIALPCVVASLLLCSLGSRQASAQSFSREAEKARLVQEYRNASSRLQTLDAIYNQIEQWLNGPGRYADPATRQSAWNASVSVGNHINATKSQMYHIRQRYNNPGAYGGYVAGGGGGVCVDRPHDVNPNSSVGPTGRTTGAGRDSSSIDLVNTRANGINY